MTLMKCMPIKQDRHAFRPIGALGDIRGQIPFFRWVAGELAPGFSCIPDSLARNHSRPEKAKQAHFSGRIENLRVLVVSNSCEYCRKNEPVPGGERLPR
jgi:hypothetical protein